MTEVDLPALIAKVASAHLDFQGPGGAIGVVVDGEIVLKRSWGYADLARRIPMSDATPMPICSISKQFTCAVLLELAQDPSRLDDRLASFLPRLEGPLPSIAQLCNMQSGLRDYWALSVLHGAHPEGVFRLEDAAPMFKAMRTTHFAPGTSYSYANSNFRILSDVIEEEAGRSLAELYAERIFAPAGMATAVMSSDTSRPAGATVGYEGNAKFGYFPATNRIFWTGDAGISASLNDMLAWERYIDRTRDDKNGLYRRLSVPQTFTNGQAASYGYGLAHENFAGTAITGHGGALRGFRVRRLYAPSARLSVVVLFNHEANAHEAAAGIMKAALGQSGHAKSAPASPDWEGWYIDTATDLLLRVDASTDGLVASYAAGGTETLKIGPDGRARSAAMTLTRKGDDIQLERPAEALCNIACRVPVDTREEDFAGVYSSGETGGSLQIIAADGALYCGFEGQLGRGPMSPIYPVGEDIWRMPCQRSMDAPAPGDWTIRVRRDGAGAVRGLTIGCWLARKLEFARAGL